MANISVNYDSLANVQNKLNGDIADDQLETIVSDLTSAENDISTISEKHDNIWGNVLEGVGNQIEALQQSIRAVHELATNVGSVSNNFFDAEQNIKDNVHSIAPELAEYFDNMPSSGLTVSENTGADTTSSAISAQPISGGGGGTGATMGTPVSAIAPTAAITGAVVEDKPKKIEDKKKNEKATLEKEAQKEGTLAKTDDQKTQSKDIKDTSTYEEAKDNAQKVSNTSSEKKVIIASTGGGTLGTATQAASKVGSINDKKVDKLDVPKEDEEVKAEAIGDTIPDEEIIDDFENIDAETDSGTHQTEPIDVTEEEKPNNNMIPALAGVAAAGLAGIGTKVVLDKKNDDEDEEDENQETFSGDYEIAGDSSTNELDSSDTIGFNPESIIEEDESNNNQNELENTIFPQTMLDDLQSKEELL